MAADDDRGRRVLSVVRRIARFPRMKSPADRGLMAGVKAAAACALVAAIAGRFDPWLWWLGVLAVLGVAIAQAAAIWSLFKLSSIHDGYGQPGRRPELGDYVQRWWEEGGRAVRLVMWLLRGVALLLILISAFGFLNALYLRRPDPGIDLGVVAGALAVGALVAERWARRSPC